jgi:hypothetical protein
MNTRRTGLLGGLLWAVFLAPAGGAEAAATLMAPQTVLLGDHAQSDAIRNLEQRTACAK